MKQKANASNNGVQVTMKNQVQNDKLVGNLLTDK